MLRLQSLQVPQIFFFSCLTRCDYEKIHQTRLASFSFLLFEINKNAFFVCSMPQCLLRVKVNSLPSRNSHDAALLLLSTNAKASQYATTSGLATAA